MLEAAPWVVEFERFLRSSFVARIGGCGGEKYVLLGQVLGQIKEVALAALALETATVLEQASGLRHAGAHDPLVHRFTRGKLLLAYLHHLVNRHVLLEL